MQENGYRIDRIRNIGIVAHIDAGKTTTTERILFYTGRIHEMGEVDEGSTEMDFLEQERERGITIKAAATTCYWRDHQINIIDTPGHVDFTAEVERSLRVLDGVITIFSGVEMVESQTEKVWRQADKYGVPRLAFVNKLDRIGSRFGPTLDMMQERLGAIPLPVQIPAGSGDEFQGMIDLIKMKLIKWDQETKGMKYNYLEIPPERLERARYFREHLLLERLAEVDDSIMIKYLSGEKVDEDGIKRAIRKACLKKGYVPTLGGSALNNIGIQPLLDAIVDYLPSPLDVPPVEGVWYEGQQTNKNRRDGKKIRFPSPEAPLAALAFKVTTDEYTGRLIYIRVYSGKLAKGSYVFNSSTGKQERIAHIFHMHANKRTEVESVSAGNIAAIVGPKELTTGDTICDPNDPIILEKIDFPEPVVSAAIEPKTQAEEERLSLALYKLAQEDPTFKFKLDQETNQTIISGMGELHLEILAERLRREFKVEANMGKPQVAYKETLAEAVDVEERFIKQTGGRGQYAHVRISFEPLESGKGFLFEDKIKGGIIPKEYIPAVQRGLEEALGSGPLGGFPITDLKAVLYDGSFHPVDSSELAFKTAAARALRKAFQRAKAELLEPIMEAEIISPSDYVGEILNDLKARRGDIKDIQVHGSTQIISAIVPLAETFGYATRLRSLTQGRATYSLKFSHYAKVPANLKEEVLRGK